MINFNFLDFDYINPGASVVDIANCEKSFDFLFPGSYKEFLKRSNGFMLTNGVFLYGLDDLVERNNTLEVQTYAPGHLAIGDDSGGISVLVRVSTEEIFSVDQGSMDIDDMTRLANTVIDWINAGCIVL